MNIVIFGGGGFIGSTLADKLLLDGHSVRVFERPRVPPYRHFTNAERMTWITGDMANAHDISDAIDGSDAVFHMVSTTLPKSSNEDPIYDVQSNVIATVQLLQIMVRLKVHRLVFISSGGTVYGPPKSIPINEDHPTNPVVSYGITKLAIEKYLNLFSQLHGMKTLALRVANPYGERQRIETAQGAIAAFIHKSANSLPIEIWGDGSVQRDYIHVSDVADAFVRALSYNGPYPVMNIGSGTGTSLNQLVSAIEKIHGKTIDVIFKPGRAIDVPINILDSRLAQRELSWVPSIDLEHGLARTLNWVLEQTTNLRA